MWYKVEDFFYWLKEEVWFEFKDMCIKWIGLIMMVSGGAGLLINWRYDYIVGRAPISMCWGIMQWLYFGWCLLQVLAGYIVFDFTKEMRE